jgi:hypothetical protein
MSIHVRRIGQGVGFVSYTKMIGALRFGVGGLVGVEGGGVDISCAGWCVVAVRGGATADARDCGKGFRRTKPQPDRLRDSTWDAFAAMNKESSPGGKEGK